MDNSKKPYINKLRQQYGIAMNVVLMYFEREILNKTCTFFFFLEQNKHELFHAYKKKAQCCKCKGSLVPSSLTSRGILTSRQFEFLYESTGQVNSNHEKKNELDKITNHCLCKYLPKQVKIIDLDISLLCAIINTCCIRTPGNAIEFNTIRDVRNFITHHGESTDISKSEFEEKWNILETCSLSLAEITGEVHKHIVQTRFQDLKKESDHESSVKEQLLNFLANHPEISKEGTDDINLKLEELLFTVKNIEFNLSLKRTGDLEEHSQETGKQNKCYARWRMLTPSHWSNDEIKNKLEAISTISGFKILFVYDGSLIVDTSFVFHQSLKPEKLDASIVDFLRQFVLVCKIKTTVKAVVDVEITLSGLPFKGKMKPIIQKHDCEAITCQTCKKQGVTIQADNWCKDCQEIYCNDCSTSHMATTCCSEHKIITVAKSAKYFPKKLMQNITCRKHGQTLDFFCKAHNIIVCIECVRVNHTKCTGIAEMALVAVNVKSSSFWDGINNKIDAFGAYIKNVLSRISKQKFKLDLQLIDIENSIDSIFKNTLSKKLDEKRAFLTDLNFKKHKCEEDILDFRKKVDEVHGDVCEMSRHLCNVAEYCSDSQILREIVKLDEIIKFAEETFKTILINAKTLTLHCEPIEEFDFQINPLTKLQIYVHSEPFCIESELSASQSRRSAQVNISEVLKKVRLIKQTTFCVKNRRRLYSPQLLILKNQLLFTSRMSIKILIYNINGYFERDISIPDMPSDISVVTDYTIAVLLFDSIVLVDIITKSVVTICTKCSYCGMSYFKGFLYLLKIMTVGFAIDIMGLSGHVIRSVRVQETDKIDRSCIIAYKDRIYILSHTNSSDLYCFDLNGKMMWHTLFRLQYKSLQIMQMAVDDKLNCYIPCYEDNSVRVVSNYGKHFTNLLTDIKKPLALNFDQKHNRLIVYNEESQCSVFDVHVG